MGEARRQASAPHPEARQDSRHGLRKRRAGTRRCDTNQYRYRTTLRPARELNLNRLGYLPGTDQPPTRDRFDHGSFATGRELSAFETNQLDLEFLGEEPRLEWGDEETERFGRIY